VLRNKHEISVVVTLTKSCAEYNTLVSYYKKGPKYFGTEVPSSGGLSIKRNVDPTRQSSYYVAFTELIIILKYIKLIPIDQNV
jgi:hypothetical protein